MSDLGRNSTAGASLFNVHLTAGNTGNDGMQRTKSTIIHRTRRGHSVIQKKVEIERMVSEKEVETLAQSHSTNPLGATGTGTGGSASLSSTLGGGGLDGSPNIAVKNSKIFDNMDGLDGTMIVCEEGTSSDDDEDGEGGGGNKCNSNGKKDDPHNKSGGKKQIKPINNESSADVGSMEAEIQQEIAACMEGKKKNCNLSRGGLETIPAGVAQCITITEISLCDNSLHSIQGAVLAPLQNLVKISLSNNRELTELPLELFQLPQLQSLTLDRCNVSSLPIDSPQGEAAMALPNLATFGAEWNNLKVFPFALLRGCPKLKELFLAENKEIQQLPDADMVKARAAQGWSNIKLKVDNRPKLMAQVTALTTVDPMVTQIMMTIDWNKIYPDKVLDFLYLGSLRTAQCPEVYQDLDIGFILTAGRDLAVKLGDDMEQLELGLDDLPGEDMKPFFKQAFEFIERARLSKRGILIHCFAGMSRSVTFTAAYLMHTRYPLTRDGALHLIRQSRPAAKPNEGFMRGLLQWEEMLKRERQ